MEKSVLDVKLLGGLTITHDGAPFSIERNTTTKVSQLLEMLLYYRSGLPRTQVQYNLFVGENVTNASNSLRALVFRLRKALSQAGLPDDDYVVIKKGIYSFTDNYEVKVDALVFEDMAKDALAIESDKEALELLEKAFELYEGDFLPLLNTSEWAIVVNVRLKKLYDSICERLCKIYQAKKNSKKLLKIATKAAALHSFDEWQAYQVEALVALGRQKEAYKIYEDTVALMMEEFGISVSARMQQAVENIGSKLRSNSAIITDVQDILDDLKPGEDGAYFCTYPAFVETYCYMKRVLRRIEKSAWLMLCTLTDGKGIALNQSDRLEEMMTDLKEAISVSVRGGDMYTRFSDNQMLVFLPGITQEDCELVRRRVASNMENSAWKRYITFNITPVDLMRSEVEYDSVEKLFAGEDENGVS